MSPENRARTAPRASLSLLTSDLPIGKHYSTVDGALVVASRAAFVAGAAQCCEIASIGDLLATIHGLNDRQALTYGVPDRTRVRVTTKRRLANTPGAIARERGSFAWPVGPGVMFFDIDAEHCARRYESACDVRSALAHVEPTLASAPMLVIPSSSAGIVNSATGATLKPAGAWHVYVLVRDASDIERCGRVVFERAWLAGLGRIVVSKSGQLLVRGLVDAAVWQPERLDYAGRVRLSPALARNPPSFATYNEGAEFFDTRCVKDLTSVERERHARLLENAREAVADEATQRAAQWDADYVRDRVDACPSDVSPEDWTRQLQREAKDARQHGRLPCSLQLLPEDGEPVTVGEVLRDPARWDGHRFADPLEHDYRNDRRIAVFFANPGTRPQLYSHAHGGRAYVLGGERVELRVEAGEMPALADDALSVIRERGEIYDYGDRALVRVVEGRTFEVSETWLADYLARECVFRRFDRRSRAWLACNVPPALTQTILARCGARELPRLSGIVTQPTLRPDGTILDRPGFDPATGLLYVCNGGRPPAIPGTPTERDARQAFETLWHPFRQFPFDGPVSMSVALAALLTAAVRSGLQTAPAFAFDAPAAGTGKTLFASCLSELRGERAAVTSPPRDDEEMRKFLVASLMSGAPVLVLDNWASIVDGNAFPALCAAITGSEVLGRILGRSETVRLPSRALIALTGNNLSIAADMVRRVLVARLDAKQDRPELRRFELDPVAYVRQHRSELNTAALTLLRAYHVHRAPANEVFGSPAPDTLGSFEAWDSLVRQAVVWAGQPRTAGGLALPGLADPIASSAASAVGDPTRNALSVMLRACFEKFEDRSFSAGDVVRVDFDNEALESALTLAFDGRSAGAVAMGRWLTRHRGAVVDGLRFDAEHDKSANAQRWRVVACR